MINFPLYEVRQYVNLFVEGEFKIVQTHRKRFVLDYIKSEFTDYTTRRLQLLRDTLPYPVYPLNKRHETLDSVIASGHKKFLDSLGRIVEWRPEKFREVLCLPIETRWTNSSGNVIIKPKGIGETFTISKRVGARYAQVVKVGKVYLLYALQYEKVPTTRKKI